MEATDPSLKANSSKRPLSKWDEEHNSDENDQETNDFDNDKALDHISDSQDVNHEGTYAKI